MSTKPVCTPRRTIALGALAVALASGCDGVGLEPELERAWVAVRPAGAEVARVGRIELDAGSEFTLHAVVEARDWRGDEVFFTEAPALELHGRRVPKEAIRTWDRRLRVRTLWFTVEAFPPFAENGEIAYRDVFQGEWPLTWSIVGDLAPSVENYLPNQENPRRGGRFGTQRYKVRVEVLGPESDILPRQSLDSWGGERLPAEAARFPTVVVALAAPLDSLSRVFGLPQREPVGEDRIAEWQHQDLAFSRLTLLRRWVDDIGSPFSDLAWDEVDLEGGTEFAPVGEPLRAGERVVWLLEDRGVLDRLDREDLCLDFERGARVRRLADVFAGDGLVERAGLRAANIEEG